MKALIVKLSAFGDIIHALPALDDLLKQPEINEVHWLVDKRFAFVSEIFPPQVKVHKVALKGDSRIRHAWQMIQTLRNENFDMIFDLQGLIKSGIMAWASARHGCKVYGFDKTQSPEWANRWFVQPVQFHPNEKHVVPLYRHIIASAFSQQDDECKYTPPSIHITDNMRTLARDALKSMELDSPFSIIHVGGSYATKRLPNTQWQDIAKAISETQNVLVLWGNQEEHQRASFIANGNNHIVLAPQCFDLPTLAGLFQEASCYIGQDTGVTHLAAASHCPTLTLWGATAPWRMGALGAMHRHIIPDTSCHPCFQRTCNHFICMPSLQTQAIYHAWQEVKQ
jgi:heptosyltransferase-1